MIEEIITKVGSINLIETNIVFGDGNPAIKRGGKDKWLIGYLIKGIYNIYIVKNKHNKKEELTNIVVENASAKLDGCVEQAHNNVTIKSDSFSVSNYRIHDEVSAALSTIASYNNKKCPYDLNAFKKGLYEKDNFFYEDKYAIIKNVPSGTYKSFYSMDKNSNVVAIRLQRKTIANQPAIIAQRGEFPEIAVAPVPRIAAAQRIAHNWRPINWNNVDDDLPF